jgi:hypothetical protein
VTFFTETFGVFSHHKKFLLPSWWRCLHCPSFATTHPTRLISLLTFLDDPE